MTKSLSSKYEQKFLGNTTKSASDALNTAKKKHNLKKAEVIGDLVGNNIAEESTKAATKNNKKKNRRPLI